MFLSSCVVSLASASTSAFTWLRSIMKKKQKNIELDLANCTTVAIDTKHPEIFAHCIGHAHFDALLHWPSTKHQVQRGDSVAAAAVRRLPFSLPFFTESINNARTIHLQLFHVVRKLFTMQMVSLSPPLSRNVISHFMHQNE